jgi:hypothetical protein
MGAVLEREWGFADAPSVSEADGAPQAFARLVNIAYCG